MGAARGGGTLELASGSLVIADLHLDPLRPAGIAALLRWLTRIQGAPALLVLGDLFEFWIGPVQARDEPVAAVLQALAAAVRSGTALHLVHGNRDFLLGSDFERTTGARVHPDPIVGRLPSGARAVLLHGDELATLDRSYQRLRSVLRSAPVRGLARGLPAGLSRALARRLRRRSLSAVAAKPPARMDLQAAAAGELAARHGARFVVCGHAHRFREEHLPGGVCWTVLDAFGGERDVLAVGSDGSLQPRSSALVS